MIMMIQREDAESIASSKKDAYVKGEALEILDECFRLIRRETNEMRSETIININRGDFTGKVVHEVVKVLEGAGYEITTRNSSRKSINLHIYWRELSEREKRDDDI